MNRLRIAFLTTILITVILAAAGFLLPAPAQWVGSTELFHVKLAIALAIPAMHVLAALFFFQGLDGFKEEFRAAYRLIAIGVILIGFTLLISPMITFFNLWNEWPMELGMVNLPWVVTVGVIFAGIRTFYRKFQVKSVWSPLWFNAVFIAAGILLAVFTPHTPSLTPEWRYDVGNALFALSTFTMTAAACNIFAIRKYIAPHYAKGLMWLGGGLLFEAVLIGMSLVLKAFGIDAQQASGGLQDFLVLAAIPYLVSGYLFYRLTADIRQSTAQSGAGIVDIIMYVASLASSRAAVDNILDGLRVVTARMRPNEQIPDTDKAKLADVYIKLENYLITGEKLRSFTATQIRSQVYARFNNQVSATVNRAFWQKIPLQK